MKKLMLMMVCVSMMFVMSGCKEKTALEKATDAAADAKKDAVEKVEEAKKEASKAADELKK